MFEAEFRFSGYESGQKLSVVLSMMKQAVTL